MDIENENVPSNRRESSIILGVSMQLYKRFEKFWKISLTLNLLRRVKWPFLNFLAEFLTYNVITYLTLQLLL